MPPALFELLGLVGNGVVGQWGKARLQAVDAFHDRHQGFDFTIVLAAEDEVQELCQHA